MPRDGLCETRERNHSGQARCRPGVFAGEWNGNSVSMPAHFRLRDSGFQLGVYVHWDDREKTWLVCHVGEHLTTSVQSSLVAAQVRTARRVRST